eukprot:GILI01011280.1.p1 GENE.GILI01011280.1~~GILI01011280.1.p1  ORF type:complete len:178 (-),score=28.71 GILI01011280.1:58-591(-)
MHSVGNRANAIFFFGLGALGVLAALNFGTTFFFTSHPQTHVRVDVRSFNVDSWLDADRAKLVLELKMDLSSLFNWNVYQLFFWVEASYNSDDGRRNDVVIWDSIIANKTAAVFRYNRILDRYSLKAHDKDLRGRNITLRSCWNVMPVSGILSKGCKDEGEFLMPSMYIDHSHHSKSR